MKNPACFLRAFGFKVTAQRLAILRAVSARPHRSADEILEDVRGELGAVTKQTIYEALAVLAERGVIRRIQPASSPALYEDRAGNNHHHLICRGCGKVVDVDGAFGALTAAPGLTAAPRLDWGRHERLSNRRGRGDLLGRLPPVPRSGPAP